MRKRLLACVLALAMATTLLPMSVFAVETGTPTTDTDASVTVNKTAEWIQDEPGYAQVTLTVNSTAGSSTSTETKATDIVLVIDRSNSMNENNNGRLTNAKTAAKAFVSNLLTTFENGVNIAVVGYGTFATIYQNLSNNDGAIKGEIDRITVGGNGDSGGTNLQAGIHQARTILEKASQDHQKIVVVLSDGAATYSYAQLGTATWKGCYYGILGSHFWDTLFSSGYVDANSVKLSDYSYADDDIVGSGASFSISKDRANSKLDVTCKHGKKNTVYYHVSKGNQDNGAPAIWEAQQTGATFYTIGYDISGNTDAENTMKAIAGDASRYYPSEGSNATIADVFDKIAQRVTETIQPGGDAVVNDPMGPYFDAVAGTLSASKGTPTIQSDGDIKWDIGELENTGIYTLTYKVKVDTDAITNGANAGTLLIPDNGVIAIKTNNNATLSYKDAGEQQRTLTFADPELECMVCKVKGTIDNGTVDLTDQYVVAGASSKAINFTAADGYEMVSYQVNNDGAQTISEKSSYTHEPFVVEQDTTIHVTTKQSELEPVSVDFNKLITKTLVTNGGSALPADYSQEFTVTVKDDQTQNSISGRATVTNEMHEKVPVSFGDNATKTFTEEGTHTYTVAETSKVTNVTNDPNLPYTMTIKVEKDDTANALTAAVSFTDKACNPVVTADTAAITVTNTYEDNTHAPTTGTLTIAKGINLSAYPEGAVYREAADGHTFAFLVKDEEGKVVATPTIRYSSVFDNGMEYAVNKTEVTLPFGTYTVEEVMETANLGYDTDTHLFKYSAKAFSGSFYGLGEAKTLSAEHPSDTVIVVNDYTTWESGFGKHASALNGTTSDITLTLPKGFIQTLVVVNSNSEVPTICAKLVDEIGSGTVNVGGKDYTYDFAFVTDAEISLELNSQTKVVAQKGEPAEDGSITYTFISKDGKEFAELVYCPENRNSQEHFTLFIYDGKYFAGSAVKLHYQVKLDPSGLTTKGTTYGTLNEYGKDTTKDSALLTNNSAILYKVGYVDNELVVGPIVTFPLPTVSYTVSGGNGGGGGHSRPTLNTEDHYGYIIGYPDGTVQPGGSITRAEVATIFFRMLTDSSRTEFWSQTNSFSDVPSTAWFNNAVSTLTKAGIIAGYEDGTFQPNATITRAEFATIAVRFFEASYDGKDFFTDIDGHWAQQYINDAANAGLVNGYEDGTFGPNKAITRAEAMTLVNRALDRHPDADHFLKDMITWPDNSDTTAWYYEAVQEATNSHEYTMKTNTDKTKYENWTKMLKMRDWKAFEAAWSDANSASNPGEVMGK